MLPTLRRRAEFLRVRGGARFECRAFVLEAKARPGDASAAVQGWRFGFTVTKKLGNAVTRNRIRRRLRDAVRLTAPERATAGHDYVLIARAGAETRDFAALMTDLETALTRVHQTPRKPPTEPRQRPPKTNERGADGSRRGEKGGQ